MSDEETVVEVDKLAGTKLGELRDLVASLEEDYLKGCAGVKTAARRVRKGVQSLDTMRSDIRTELLSAMKKDKED
tara:strand:- start:65021 stop:65245 length:225 start_codon:yes stop_codon:yes gene_type:complete